MRCDDCYNLVQNKVTKLRGRITVLDESLNSAKPGVDAEPFNQHAKDIEQKLTTLKTEIGTLSSKLFPEGQLQPTYKDSVKGLEQQIANISAEIKRNQKIYDKTESDVNELNKFYQKVDKLIGDAQLQITSLSVLQESKVQELESAVKSQAEETDPNMIKLSEKANLAREKSEEHHKMASDFVKGVIKGLENARLLLLEVNDLSAMSAQFKLANDLDHDEASIIAEHLIKQANSSKNAIEAGIKKYTDGLDAVSKVELDEEKYDKVANEFNKDISELDKFVLKSKKEIDELNQNATEAGKKSAVQIDLANVEMGIARAKDADLSVLLERSEAARNRTEISLALAKEAFANASEIVETLENFDAKLEENKESAAKQWNLKPEAEANIETARNLSIKLSNDLYQTRSNIEKASAFSNDVLVDLKRASQGIEFLGNSSALLADNSKDLESKVSVMETKFSRLNKTLAGASEKQKTERERVTDLYTRASAFVGKSQDLLNSINNAEYELTLIKPQTIQIQGIDMAQINKLKEDFNKILVDLDKVTDIEPQIQELIEREEQSRRELIIYEREIPQLKLQIGQLDKMSDLLKNEKNCAKNTGVLNIS